MCCAHPELGWPGNAQPRLSGVLRGQGLHVASQVGLLLSWGCVSVRSIVAGWQALPALAHERGCVMLFCSKTLHAPCARCFGGFAQSVVREMLTAVGKGGRGRHLGASEVREPGPSRKGRGGRCASYCWHLTWAAGLESPLHPFAFTPTSDKVQENKRPWECLFPVQPVHH